MIFWNGILKFAQDHLKEFTGGFSDENYLDRTESHSFIGNPVYRGNVIIVEVSNWVRNVIVEVKEPHDGLVYEVWEVQYGLPLYQMLIRKIVTNFSRTFLLTYQTQIRVFTDPVLGSHPNVAKLYGYCNDEMLGLVYDCDALQTMHNMVPDGSIACTLCPCFDVSLHF